MPHFYVAWRGKLCNYVSTVNQDRWEYQMAFTVVKKTSGRTGGFTHSAPVQVAKWAKAGSILLNNDIVQQLGWKLKDKIEVSIGSGEDSGLIALRRAADGYTLSISGGKQKQARINCKHILPYVAKAASTTCKYQIIRDALYVQLPARLMAPEARDGGSSFKPNAFTNGQLVAAE
jgi:hypothetical protein